MLSRLIAVASIGLAPVSASESQSITPLSQVQVASYTPFTHFASAANCDPALTRTWSCGEHCKANPFFHLTASGGGDGVSLYWYVGYDPAHATAIVAHQEATLAQTLVALTGKELIPSSLNPGLFPGVPSSVQVHSGFARDQARTASDILSTVQDVISMYNTTSVTTVGYAVGAAISLLDTVYLRLHLPSTVSVRAVLYALPRVGDQDWADFVDARLPGHVTRINNMRDPVPVLPPLSFGFHHCSGEIHIAESGQWYECPGQDNPSDQCIVGVVGSLFFRNWRHHDGPYNGISARVVPEW